MKITRIQSGPRMSKATLFNGMLHISGQVATDRKSSIEVQTQQVLDQIEEIITEAGGFKSGLLAVNVFLPHITDFAAMNSIYDAWIDAANPPARACVEARLADPDLRVEMTAVCAIQEI
jgi:enamine deaminase RidA (YjgF/YER057c/UK114 family)